MERQFAYLGRSVEEARQLTELTLAKTPEVYLDMDARYSDTATAQSLNLPMLILQGERDYQVTMDDYRAWREAVGNRQGVVMKSYPSLNPLFMSGEGASMPEEYQTPGHVAEEVMDDIANFILSGK